MSRAMLRPGSPSLAAPKRDSPGMTSFFLICAVVELLAFVSGTAQAQSTNDIPQPVEQCIRVNAPAVERAVPSLTEAVNLLVDDVCAVPIAEAEARQMSERMAALNEQMKKKCAPYKKPQPMLTPQGEENPCATTDVGPVDPMSGWTLYAPSNNRPAVPTAFAAKILLDLRIARMNATPTEGTH